jgi:hypothetical protein
LIEPDSQLINTNERSSALGIELVCIVY